MAFYEDIKKQITEEERVKREEPMKQHTTFHAGGTAEYFISVHSEKELVAVLALCHEYSVPVTILGNGSNILVSDRGLKGAVLKLSGDLKKVRLSGETTSTRTYEAGAGVLLSTFAMKVAKEGCSGFEFAAGIPGSVGGAVVMNAGAYDGEVKNFLISAKLVFMDGTSRAFSADELKLSYRHSILSEQDAVVTKAVFTFPLGERDKSLGKIKELAERRAEKQPLNFFSAGSTFKRPEGYYAGKLIMDAGLSGVHIGDAEVSKKHCGFVINKGNASADEIYRLICLIIKTVKEKSGVTLDPEVKLLGDFSQEGM